MSTKAQRGTKRTCQNPECGSRYYDLNRDPIVCPICQSAYQLAVTPVAEAAAAQVEKVARKPAKKPEYEVVAAKPESVPVTEGAEELAVIEGDEETPVADDDETFLEEDEEDGSDVSGIIGGPVAETDEQP